MVPAAIAAAAEGTQTTVNGWVLDSACTFTKGLTKPISRDCALACAKAGSPLVLLSVRWINLLADLGHDARGQPELETGTFRG